MQTVRSTNGRRCHKGSVKPFFVIKIVAGLEFRGSIPSSPTKKKIKLGGFKKFTYLCETNGPLVKWFNTLPFHGRGTGSNPVRTTNNIGRWQSG